MPGKFCIAGAVLLVAIALTAAFTSIELMASEDALSPGDILADFIEAFFISAAMFSSALFVSRLRGVEAETAILRRDVADASAAGAAWRRQSQRLMDGLSAAIKLQFDEWHLSEAECDVAGLILKGMSLREIAQARDTSEATIRQQAQSVYRKSGLSNRAELAAYFLDDLFVSGQPPEHLLAPARHLRES